MGWLFPKQTAARACEVNGPISQAELYGFIAESNAIEGLFRAVWRPEYDAHLKLLELPWVEVGDLQRLVEVLEPGALLRDKAGMNVRVGSHVAPNGGPKVAGDLEFLLRDANEGVQSPFEIHRRYETLHPFMDGNGRSGRALWLCQMEKAGTWWPRPSFLHAWYYQSLDAARDAQWQPK